MIEEKSEVPNCWQPIETAPKDAKQILATWADSWPNSPHVEAVYYFGGVWYYAYDGDAHNRPPTHWMPLPAPPEATP